MVFKKCEVPTCRISTSNGGQNKTYYAFPRDYERSKIWYLSISKPYDHLEPNSRVYRYVCEDHFDDDDVCNLIRHRLTGQSKRLKPGSVPHKLLPNQQFKGKSKYSKDCTKTPKGRYTDALLSDDESLSEDEKEKEIKKPRKEILPEKETKSRKLRGKKKSKKANNEELIQEEKEKLLLESIIIEHKKKEEVKIIKEENARKALNEKIQELKKKLEMEAEEKNKARKLKKEAEANRLRMLELEEEAKYEARKLEIQAKAKDEARKLKMEAFAKKVAKKLEREAKTKDELEAKKETRKLEIQADVKEELRRLKLEEEAKKEARKLEKEAKAKNKPRCPRRRKYDDIDLVVAEAEEIAQASQLEMMTVARPVQVIYVDPLVMTTEEAKLARSTAKIFNNMRPIAPKLYHGSFGVPGTMMLPVVPVVENISNSSQLGMNIQEQQSPQVIVPVQNISNSTQPENIEEEQSSPGQDYSTTKITIKEEHVDQDFLVKDYKIEEPFSSDDDEEIAVAPTEQVFLQEPFYYGMSEVKQEPQSDECQMESIDSVDIKCENNKAPMFNENIREKREDNIDIKVEELSDTEAYSENQSSIGSLKSESIDISVPSETIVTSNIQINSKKKESKI